MRELVSEPVHEYPQFGVALSLISVISPPDAAALLRQRLGALAAEADEIRTTVQPAVDGGLQWVFLVEEEYRRALVEAEHRFVEGLIASLEDPDYVAAWNAFFSGGKP
jgi:hypothetical protein